jgi:hypothetical protein
VAIIVSFPDKDADVPTNSGLAKFADKYFGGYDGTMKVGHAGIVLISGEGNTNYFDFGRYDRKDIKGRRGKNDGAVRSSVNYASLRLPNWSFNKSDRENVSIILTRLRKSPLFNGYGRILGTLAKNLDYNSMLAYTRGAEREGYLPFGGYHQGYNYCNSATYCAKFVRAVGQAGGIDWNWTSFSGEDNVESVEEDYDFDRVELPAPK